MATESDHYSTYHPFVWFENNLFHHFQRQRLNFLSAVADSVNNFQELSPTALKN